MTNADDLKEFKQEGSELLEAAEKALLSLEEGAAYKTQYNAVFRAFHNLKGAAGMMDMTDLQSHTHILETELVGLKENDNLTSEQVDYFLVGIDTAKKLLDGEPMPLAVPMSEHKHTPQVIKQTPNQDVQSNFAGATVSSVPESSIRTDIQTETKPELKIIVDNEKNKPHLIIEPTRYLLFSEGAELVEHESYLRGLGYEVHNHTDYIDGITKYDSLKPDVVIISPEFKQTSIEELKSIVGGNSDKEKTNHQLFIDYNFSGLQPEVLFSQIKLNFENLNLKKLAGQAAKLLKYQYADLSDYLKSNSKDHIEKELTANMRDFLNLKSEITLKFG